MSEMRVLSPKGDVKTIWDPNNEEEVTAAREQFDRLVSRGTHLAYRVEEGGKRSEQIREFDPQAGSIILTPRMVGG